MRQLRNQLLAESWKDSGEPIMMRDGTLILYLILLIITILREVICLLTIAHLTRSSQETSRCKVIMGHHNNIKLPKCLNRRVS